MTINDMLEQGILIEGNIEILRWNDDEVEMLFKGDASEVDFNADYMEEDVVYMFAYNDVDENAVLRFELESN